MTSTTVDKRLRPSLGDDVATMDGHKLGRIQEIRGPYFRVKKGIRGHGFWLETEFIYDRGESHGPLMVSLLADRVEEYKVPEQIVHDRALLDPHEDHLLPDEQLREQRERMERDLLRH
jgi:hypothetical protein